MCRSRLHPTKTPTNLRAGGDPELWRIGCKSVAPMTSRAIFCSILFLGAAACGGKERVVTPPVQTDNLGVVLRIFADARVGENYIEPLQAKGGTPPYSFALASDTLPDGLSVVGSAVAGVPTEAGRFSAIVEVTDAEGAKATGAVSVRVLEIDTPDMPIIPTPMLPASRCDAPTFLELNDSVRLTATLPETAGEYADTACGLNDQDAATFFVVPVSADSKLTVSLQSSDNKIRAGWLANRCPSASALNACGEDISVDVVAGNYLLLVAGTPGASFVLELTREDTVPPPPPGPPSCDNPTAVDLSSGSAVMAGSFDELLSENNGTCTYGYKEAVLEVTLDETADLRISSTSSGLGLYLRSGACDYGREVACNSYDPIYLPNVAAGTYYLFIEQRWSDEPAYSVLVEKLPATPRPSNDTCSTAAPITFVNNRATVTANLTAAVASSSFGCTNGQAAFYTFELSEPKLVKLRSSSSNFSMELGQGSCLVPQSLVCGDGYNEVCAPDLLPAGSYWVTMYERWSQIPAINSMTIELSDPPVAPANDLCEDAQDATPGSSGSLTLSGVLDGAENEYTGPAQCVYSGAYPEVYYTLEVTERSDLSATITSNSYGIAAYMVSGGCGAPDEVQCLSSYGSTMYGVEPGTYGIVVENTQSISYNNCPQTGASFQLTVNVQPSRPQPSNDLCVGSSTIALPAVGSVLSIIGTTQGAGDTVSTLQCPNSYSFSTGGADVFYKIITGETGRLAISATAASPVMISLHGATCDASGAFACSSYGNALETLGAFPAGEYYVRVDHDTQYSSSYTPTDFVLTAQLLP